MKPLSLHRKATSEEREKGKCYLLPGSMQQGDISFDGLTDKKQKCKLLLLNRNL